MIDRGVPGDLAILAAQVGGDVHGGVARWVRPDDPAAFRRLLDESLYELRSRAAA